MVLMSLEYEELQLLLLLQSDYYGVFQKQVYLIDSVI